MSLCILAGGKVTALAVSVFTLSWTHSVQKTEWRETWAVTPTGLELRQAELKGSGAGMEPGADAVLKDGWWVWTPKLPPQERVSLAASGMTPTGWKLCHAGGCMELGAAAGDEVSLSRCP
ncbi:DUF1850 domain-containing protein [Neorhizobium galegae]|uniref:DUF1850 domain-containing protein n=1 Tax=Neorhizobium galegae TaxID=399 RepID=UPI000621CC0E|nr:DUF1850 domain-containing protein [Neorhizobium galegae]CDZ28771.1 Hypothetical protein NGAL_HAMBI490_36320 [Neorhizobium galegae bv. officinalis]KAA9386144.1 DUF1850 domain-containing protein [Neorhizobium galegae]KAB1113413.1 DUF1850 domain-containing protein [Neorhizobium galegae]MCM2496370.1 DUF1850 domain-containing protein [Neorhizobium galegae]MCQ1770494.1 DUF1850 domain-containing protein [Neorhizobium galegae]